MSARHLVKAALILPLASLGSSACDADSHQEARAAAQADATPLEVREATVERAVPVHGSVEAPRTAALSTRMMAQVTGVSVDVGDAVEAGQVLVELGTDDVAAHRAKAEAAVMAATAARDEAARHAARMDTLLAQDAVARVQRDQARLGLVRAQAQLTMAEATLDEIRTADRYATLRAPFAGVVVSRTVDPGALATPGAPLVTVAGSGPRDAVLAVPPDVAAGLAPGTELSVTTGGGRSARAAVRAIAGGADPDSRTVEVRASLPADWLTGIAVTALVPAGSRSVVTVPERAVVRRGQLTGVRVVTREGPVLRWVRLGRTVTPTEIGATGSEGHVEVLSGLTAGERILP